MHRKQKRGIEMHTRISSHLTSDKKSRWAMIDNFIYLRAWRCVASEKSVCREGVRGRIDAIFKKKSGTTVLVDWKSGYRRNFTYDKSIDLIERFNGTNSYILQLNLYRWILSLKESECCMYIVFINNRKMYEVEVPFVSDSEITFLVNLYKYNKNIIL